MDSSIWRRRQGAFATALALCCTGAASADDPALEEILVTGTRIAQPGSGSASPVVAVPGSLFEQSGSLSVERTLVMMPQFVPSAGAATNDPSNDGQENLSLRGLGPTRTLVLVDGKRLVPADGRGAVDVNMLPPALVSKVEVMTGGASTAYGSDAIAGVVNFHLLERYEGVELSGEWIQTTQGDGEAWNVGLLGGTRFADSRGSVVGYVGHSERSQLDQGDRQFSRYSYAYYPGETGGHGPGGSFLGSGNVPEAGLAILLNVNPAAFDALFTSYGYAPGSVTPWPALGVNEDGTVFTMGNGDPGSVVNYKGDRDPAFDNDRFFSDNTTADTALVMPLDRTTAFLRASLELAPQAELYGQAIFADYRVTRQLATIASGVLLIPTTNPYMPADLKLLADSRSNPAAPIRFFARPTSLGPSRAQNDRSVLQLDVGLRGEVGEGWSYDVYLQGARNERSERQTNLTSVARFEELLYAPDGGLAACGGLDVFGKGHISKACADYVSVNGSNEARLDEFIAEATANGRVFTVPAGDARAAVGAVYRRDQFRYSPGPTLDDFVPAVPGVIGRRPDVSGMGVGAARSGTTSNTDLYAELLLPLLSGESAAAPLLDADAGYRYSRYRQVGGVASYKGELRWRPRSSVLLRGSYQHAVRAPSVEELYYPQLSDQFFVNFPEPCSIYSDRRNGPDAAMVKQLCLTQGVPADLWPNFEAVRRLVDGVAGGNPDLRPEEADTVTTGFVLKSPFENTLLDDASLSVDWYKISYDDAIGRWNTASAVERCYDPAYNPDYSASSPYCGFFHRDSVTGEVVAEEIERNIGRVETSGIDVALNWAASIGPGRAAVTLNLNHVNTWKVDVPGGHDNSDYAGTIGHVGLGGAIPRWRSLLQADYQWRLVGAYARWQYVDGMRDSKYSDFHVPAANYLAVGATLNITQGTFAGLGLTVGIDNLFDESPPLYPSYSQANTDTAQYDVLGRRYFVSLRYRL